ncbi:MAG: hypothetical protein L3J82_04920 [Planctomycetes bacterium]|nr:hypothetical protein [Planctomycetota bacterium]
MIKRFMWVPMLALVFVVTSCGASGGTPEPKQIADAAYAKIIAQDFDTLIELMDTSDMNFDASAEVRAWRIEEKFDTWKAVKEDYKGDEGYDPEKESGIEDEESWKEMKPGTEMALKMGLYKVYANDEWEKRLTELPWEPTRASKKLQIEGQGTATFKFRNVYKDSIEILCERKDGMWYLAGVELRMAKEVPEPPKKDDKKDD